MVLEIVQLLVKDGQGLEFEKAMDSAKPLVTNSKGAIALRLQQCVEDRSKYFVLIEWETIEDHLEGFRNSDAFTKWREILSPYFAQPPHVEHFNEVKIP